MLEVIEVMAVSRSDGRVLFELWAEDSVKDASVVMTPAMALKAAERLLHAARSAMLEGKA